MSENELKISVNEAGNESMTPEEHEARVRQEIFRRARADAESFLDNFQKINSLGALRVIYNFNLFDREIYEAANESAKKYNFLEKDLNNYLESFRARCMLGYPLGEA